MESKIIFKKSDTKCHSSNCAISLSRNDILEAIPFGSVAVEDTILQKTHTEWRWRFFNINGRKLIEISKKNPCSIRFFLNRDGKWMNYDDKNIFDMFMTDTLYYYS